METIFLLDGNALAYRAHFAIRALSDSRGRPTNAVYGFLVMLEKTVRDHRPDYLACAFDSPGETFRHKLFAGYKRDRPGMPDNLVRQLPLIRELLAAWRIPALELPGLEADDLLHFMVRRALARGVDACLVTSDKDLCQLVSDRVTVLDPRTRQRLGPGAVEAKFGVPPALIPDLLALAGDPGDSIPGVAGVGAGTARNLLARFRSVGELYRRLAEVEPAALREKLAAGRADALLGLKLTALAEAPLPPDFRPPDWPALRRRPPDPGRLGELYQRLEFRRHLAGLGRPAPPAPARPPEQPRLFPDA